MKQRGSLLKDMSILLFFSALVRAFFAFTCLNFFASAMNLRLFDSAHIWLYRGAVMAANVMQIIVGYGASAYVWLSGVAVPAVYILGAIRLKRTVKQ